MRILSVITIEEGIVKDIKSFGINTDDDVKQAERHFTDIALSYEADEDDMECYIEDGYYAGGNFSVCLTWSEI